MGKFLVLLDDGHPLNEILRLTQSGCCPSDLDDWLLALLRDVTGVTSAMNANGDLREALVLLASDVLVWLEATHGKRLVISELSENEGEKKA